MTRLAAVESASRKDDGAEAHAQGVQAPEDSRRNQRDDDEGRDDRERGAGQVQVGGQELDEGGAARMGSRDDRPRGQEHGADGQRESNPAKPFAGRRRA